MAGIYGEMVGGGSPALKEQAYYRLRRGTGMNARVVINDVETGTQPVY